MEYFVHKCICMTSSSPKIKFCLGFITIRDYRGSIWSQYADVGLFVCNAVCTFVPTSLQGITTQMINVDTFIVVKTSNLRHAPRLNLNTLYPYGATLVQIHEMIIKVQWPTSCTICKHRIKNYNNYFAEIATHTQAFKHSPTPNR